MSRFRPATLSRVPSAGGLGPAQISGDPARHDRNECRIDGIPCRLRLLTVPLESDAHVERGQQRDVGTPTAQRPRNAAAVAHLVAADGAERAYCRIELTNELIELHDHGAALARIQYI